jgi:hypothetical protein
MPLLDEIGHGQAVMAVARRDRDHEAHVGGGEAVQRGLVMLLAPAHGEPPFLLAFEERGVHGGANEATTDPGTVTHGVLPAVLTQFYGGSRRVDNIGSTVVK